MVILIGMDKPYRLEPLQLKSYRFLIALLLGFLIFIVLAGCSVEQRIVLDEDLSGRWTMNGRAQDFTATTLDDLALLGGYDDAAQLYGGAINQAEMDMEKRSSVESAEIRLIGPHSWNADIRFTDLEDLLGAAEGSGIAEISQLGKIVTLKFLFNRSTAKNIEKLMPILTDPAISLFNPASTENIDEESYITNILGFSFGAENIPAIRASKVILEVVLPGPIVNIRGGTKTSGNSVRFEAPLSRFLVPERGVDWMVSWKNAG